MARQLPPLNWFRAFDAAARHLSFTAAAEEMGLTQSAVSQHVKALEGRLGVPLFFRKPRGLMITEAGRMLVPEVAAALARLQAAAEAFGGTDDRPEVHIAASLSVIQWLILPNLADFRAGHPSTRLRMETFIWPDDFAGSEAAVQVRFGPTTVVGGGARPLGSARRVFVCAPHLAPPSLDAALDLPLIQAIGTTDTWAGAATDWAKAGLVRDRAVTPTIEVDTYGLAVALAINGAGVALTNAMIAGPALSDGRLVEVAAPEARLHEGYYLAVQPNAATAARAFADWLIALADGGA